MRGVSMLQKWMELAAELGTDQPSTQHPMAKPSSAALGPRAGPGTKGRSSWGAEGVGREWRQERRRLAVPDT